MREPQLRGRQGRVRRRAGQEDAQEVQEGVGHAVPVLAELLEEVWEARRLCQVRRELGGAAKPTGTDAYKWVRARRRPGDSELDGDRVKQRRREARRRCMGRPYLDVLRLGSLVDGEVCGRRAEALA